MKHKAFTLIEILVVIAIIAILAGILLPVLTKAKANRAPVSKIKTELGAPDLWKVTVDGHEYIGFGTSAEGGALCHSESCPCKKL